MELQLELDDLCLDEAIALAAAPGFCLRTRDFLVVPKLVLE